MQLSESASDHVFKQQEAPSTPELGNPLKHSPQLQSISIVDTFKVKDTNQGQIGVDGEVVSTSASGTLELGPNFPVSQIQY